MGGNHVLKQENGNVFKRIYEVVRKIPYGKVATYGQVALVAGNPHWARVVGYALHVNPDPQNIKCYRVVNRNGNLAKSFSFGGIERQAELLRAEGVEVSKDGTVDLKKFGATFKEMSGEDFSD